MNKFTVSCLAVGLTLGFGAKADLGTVFHKNPNARALQQHIVSSLGLIGGVANDVADYLNQTGAWPAAARIDATNDNVSEYPLEFTYAIANEGDSVQTMTSGSALLSLATGTTQQVETGASSPHKTAVLLVTFNDESDAGEENVNLPKALQGKHILLTAELSPNGTTVERYTCKTDVDLNADLWDGYLPPAEGQLSRLVSGLGGIVKDCKYDQNLANITSTAVTFSNP